MQGELLGEGVVAGDGGGAGVDVDWGIVGVIGAAAAWEVCC